MPYPTLPVPAPGEVLLICTCYAKGRARWGEVLDALGGRRDGDAVVLEGGVRLRLAEHPRWNYLRGGNLPALVAAGGAAPPVVVLADSAAVLGDDAVLLVDLHDIPGRGVRVAAEDLGGVLAGLLGGSLRLDELVRGMDRFGVYQGDNGTPATPTPTRVIRTRFPRLPASEGTLLVRTDFTDEQGWRAFAGALGGSGEEGRLPTDEEFYDAVELCVATRIPLAEAASMAVNLELANMDFGDFA